VYREKYQKVPVLNNTGVQNFLQFMDHLQILGARKVAWSKSLTEDPQFFIHKARNVAVMMKILDATTQKYIHLGDKECGLDNVTLLNKNARVSEKHANHLNLIICSKLPTFTKTF